MKKNFFKSLIALSFFGGAFLFSNNAFSQTYEIGGFIGLGMYKGELSSTPNPLNFGGNYFLLGRYNIDNYSTLRFSLGQSIFSGNDQNQNSNLASQRNANFDTNLGEMALIYEHNFFPYRKEKERINTTPYVFGGLGIMGFSSSGGSEEPGSSFGPIIPFGVGVKNALNKNWNLNFEFGTRKTFTDFLDNTHDEVNQVQTGFKNTYDWYSFLSVGLTYTIYPIKCPQ